MRHISKEQWGGGPPLPPGGPAARGVPVRGLSEDIFEGQQFADTHLHRPPKFEVVFPPGLRTSMLLPIDSVKSAHNAAYLRPYAQIASLAVRGKCRPAAGEGLSREAVQKIAADAARENDNNSCSSRVSNTTAVSVAAGTVSSLCTTTEGLPLSSRSTRRPICRHPRPVSGPPSALALRCSQRPVCIETAQSTTRAIATLHEPECEVRNSGLTAAASFFSLERESEYPRTGALCDLRPCRTSLKVHSVHRMLQGRMYLRLARWDPSGRGRWKVGTAWAAAGAEMSSLTHVHTHWNEKFGATMSPKAPGCPQGPPLEPSHFLFWIFLGGSETKTR